MDSVHLGPLLVPTQVVLLFASVLLAQAAATWFHKTRGVDVGPILWKMLFSGFGAARLIFVLRHQDLYLVDPVSIIDLRDGGFDELAGFATALMVGTEASRRLDPLRRPLMLAVLAGCIFYFGGTSVNNALMPMGSLVPAVEVRRLDGSTVPLSHFAGRPLVVNLWATWCPPCRREMPALQAAQKALPDVAFVFVNQGESAQAVERYLMANGLKMSNVVIDPARQVSVRTGSAGYPTTLFYDAGGRMRLRQVGELSQATLNEKVSALFNVR